MIETWKKEKDKLKKKREQNKKKYIFPLSKRIRVLDAMIKTYENRYK